jgi:hypothetical protein
MEKFVEGCRVIVIPSKGDYARYEGITGTVKVLDYDERKSCVEVDQDFIRHVEDGKLVLPFTEIRSIPSA